MEWVSLEIGERRPFWGATSILGEGFLSQNNKPKQHQRQRQTTLFCSAEDSAADEGCSSEQIDTNDAEDRPIAPLAGPAGSDSEATRLSPSF